MKVRIASMALLMSAAACLAQGDGNSGAGIWIPPKPERSDGQLVVHEAEETGRISPQNGVCGAPDFEGSANFAAWKAAAFPYSRTHDLNNCMGYGAPYVIDVPWIFRNFDADENDPANYEFACTDALLKRMRSVGVEPFYRLGVAFESFHVKHYTTAPPKDFAKWARVCERIVAHYTEGWADGFRWKMDYWEFWNEPDLAPRKSRGMNIAFWTGSRDEFLELWLTVHRHLKARFPNLKFGGAGFVHAVGGDWGEAMVKEFAARGAPLDFYSWHCYTTNPRQLGTLAAKVRRMLDSCGCEKTLSVIDEWNYVSGWTSHDLRYSQNVWQGSLGHKAAAFIAAGMIELDAAGVDIGMFYDARRPGMNALFDPISGVPIRGHYPFVAWRNLRRLGARVRTSGELGDDVWAVAAKGADGRIGVLLSRFVDDDNATRSKRITLRLASGRSLAEAMCHLTDCDFIYTACDPEVNADGSIDLVLEPCSFAYVETGRPDGLAKGEKR